MKWVTIKQASQELGIAYIKISRMSRKGQIKSERDPLNDRTRLVDIDEIRLLVDRHNELLGESSTQETSIHDHTEQAL
jgi:predicted site-specific integrase-resolvase